MIDITKKNLMITIEEKLLKKAKNQIPNLSEFFEYCLKNYLGEIKGLVPISKQQELIDTIGRCQLELYLMNEKGHVEENKKKAEAEEINFTWRKLFKEYRDRGRLNPNHLEEAAEKLGVSPPDLRDILFFCNAYSYQDQIDNSDWSAVYERYGYD